MEKIVETARHVKIVKCECQKIMYSQGCTLVSTLFFVLYRNVKYLTVIDNADLYFGLMNCKVVLGCFKS